MLLIILEKHPLFEFDSPFYMKTLFALKAKIMYSLSKLSICGYSDAIILMQNKFKTPQKQSP